MQLRIPYAIDVAAERLRKRRRASAPPPCARARSFWDTIGDFSDCTSARPAQSGEMEEIADAFWLTACAWCERVRIDGDWLGGVTAKALARCVRQVSHGICPACLKAVSDQADAQRRRCQAA
jgi:hypothetical protein